MSKHDDGGERLGQHGRQGRGDTEWAGHAGGGRGGAVGKRTATQAVGSSDPASVLRARLDVARGQMRAARSVHLPALRATLAERNLQDARMAALELRQSMSTIARELDDARERASALGSDGALDQIDDLTAEHDLLVDEVEPVLLRAPAPAAPISPLVPFSAHLDTGPPAGSEDADGRRALDPWNAALDEHDASAAAAGAGAKVIDASRRFARGDADTQRIAAEGVANGGSPLPHQDTIQKSFGQHDVSGISAHVGGEAAGAASAIGAEAYATGSHVAFATPPSLFVAAHEAAHVVQQRAGVSLLGGVGEAGDSHELHADAVAERVVRGESAEALLGDGSYGAGTAAAVQRMAFGASGDAIEGAARTAAAATTIGPTPTHSAVRVGDTFQQSFEIHGATGKPGRGWQVKPSSPALEVSDPHVKGARWSATVEAASPGFASLEAQHPDVPGATGVAGAAVAVPEAEVQTVRIHQPAQFEDPVASTLYPGDWIRARARLDVGDHARFSGQIIDPSGVLRTVSASYAHPELTVWARAEKEGAATPVLELRPHGGSGAFETLHRVEVVPALAGRDGEPQDRRVTTIDIDSAVHLLLEELKMLLRRQQDGVEKAKTELVKRRKAPTVPWWAPALAFAAETALSFVTAGIGNGIGRSMAGRASTSRDITIGSGTTPLKVFDIESAFGTALKDGMKNRVHAVVGEEDTTHEVVDELWAVELFCDAQISALEEATINESARWINQFKSFKDVEAAQPGAGLAAVEAQRHALAVESEGVTGAQFQATMKEWLLYQARSTHGVVPSTGAKQPADGTNLGAEGRGEIAFTATPDLSDPSAPVRVTSMRFTSLLASTAKKLQEEGGTIGGLGLPFTVGAARSFTLGRNESGEVWITLITGAMGIDAGWAKSARRYLFQKGTGAEHWDSEAELEAGMAAGARRITESEVAPLDLRDVPLSKGFGE